MDILKFITAGNVDDGKSTLIGRLLFDTGNIKTDVLLANNGRENQEINLAHVTDGLRSEREQGITIDVAYKYFTTANRKYIVTDAPGHFQYTKNLVTGASGVDVMIVLIDALNGITEQTRRHSLVASFLNIPQIVVAINKMDAVDFNEQVFQTIQEQYLTIARKLKLQNISFIAMSALLGDSVIHPSKNMDWYNGMTLMHYLETCQPILPHTDITRFSVQCIIDTAEKGFGGKLLSGILKVGDSVNIYPGAKNVTIKEIIVGAKHVPRADAGQNICVYFEQQVDIERGALVCKFHENTTPQNLNKIRIKICWLDTQSPLQVNDCYYLRINSFETICNVTEIVHKTDVDTFEEYSDSTPISVNEFAHIIIETKDTVAFDSFKVSPPTGRGILINMNTFYTSAAFTIQEVQ
jgi:sulfate adenylyltransferase subunit 1